MTNEIELLCEKFNTTVNFLVEEMAKYYITQTSANIIISLIIVIMSSILITVSYKYYKKSLEDWPVAGILTGGILDIFFVLNLLYDIPNLIGWIVSPYGAMLKMVVK